jgi:OHCU decarboxylase
MQQSKAPISTAKFSMPDVNGWDQQNFVRILGPVFEHSPWIAENTWSKNPFATLAALHEALCTTVANSSEQQKLDLIRAHPDLVGRAALAGTLTSASTKEQASAGLDKLSAEEIAAFQKFNTAYHERFGFPFIICARLNKKEAILEGFRRRLNHSSEQEIQTALEEIGKIARFRLADLIQE